MREKIHVGQTSASLGKRARNQEVGIVPSVQRRGHFLCKSKSSDTESPCYTAHQHFNTATVVSLDFCMQIIFPEPGAPLEVNNSKQSLLNELAYIEHL